MNRCIITGVSVTGLVIAATAVVLTSHQEAANAHCQVPCGIYDDPARIAMLREDATTIAKAIDEIRQHSDMHDPQAFNQSVRWVTTKDFHASHVIEVVSEYFLTQRVKPVESGSGDYQAYLTNLADHHAVMVAAMKTKQQCDPASAKALIAAIDGLAKHYAK